MNKTHPQRNGDVATLGSTESFSGKRESLLSHRAWPSSFCTPVQRTSSDGDVTFVPFNSSALEQQHKFFHTASSRILHGGGRCHPCGACPGCTQRLLCIAVVVLLVLVAALALGLTLTLLPRAPVTRSCTAPNNKTGFLCDDRVTCVPASWVCDRVSNCRNGEDEQEQLCGDLPHSLPGNLVFYCSNPRSWVYADQRCNGMNECGDCSDETWSLAACPPCGQEWWSCSSVHFEFCSCIPRRLCRDGVQHCLDWSDEFACTA